ncbi:hypothetical protein EPA93_24570 [Ktedonosporobacter rubrisoli]|uniref:Uncharacterized protein n=1 Tax=Ktedonosporobacter rubrisoli TaxID=2509675 RepID=A0A4P6JUG3_KTERU|nr:hypothetical protein [Ktedonosporobacter rubrisoli]QBD78985.1 hypothetical protein EPA93_24570 [Ktedonosporobacter rubrisoli]
MHANLPALQAVLKQLAKALARYATLVFHNGYYSLEQHATSYDDHEIFQTFEQRQVPDRELLYRVFFGGRLKTGQAEP